MGNYMGILRKTNIQSANIIRRNSVSKNKWASDQIYQYNTNHTTGNSTKKRTNLNNQSRNNIHSNYALFADDTSIDINNII